MINQALDRSVLDPLNLMRLALELQWPAMLLGVVTCTVACVNRIRRVPEVLRVETAWLSSPAVLIAGPIYLWGCTAAFDTISFFDAFARSGASSAQGFLGYIWATSFAQFLALFAVFFPGFVTALTGDQAIRSRDVAGVPWAIAAVATDYLLSLVVFVPPIGRP